MKDPVHLYMKLTVWRYVGLNKDKQLKKITELGWGFYLMANACTMHLWDQKGYFSKKVKKDLISIWQEDIIAGKS